MSKVQINSNDAYAKAQELLGAAGTGSTKLGNNGERVLTVASEDEALKIASIVEQAGKTAAVSIIVVKNVLGRPKREDFASDEDFQSEDEHFWESSRQGVGDFTEETHIYQVRAFDSGEQALEGLYSIDWNDKDLVPASVDLKVHTKDIEEWKSEEKDVTEELADHVLALFSESLIVDRDNPYIETHGDHEAFMSNLNYDHEGGVLKEAKIFFIPELPED